jgi:predicted transcriptional regulator
MRNRVVTAHIPDELARKLDSLAERLERSRGWVVKEALEGYLALEEERHRETLAALAEVDAGTTVDHAEVRAWARGLAPARRRKARR